MRIRVHSINSNMKLGLFFLCLIMLFNGVGQGVLGNSKNPILVNSPDGKVNLKLDYENNGFTYQLYWDGELLVKSSLISLISGVELDISTTTSRTVDENWKPVWGQFSSIRNLFNETTILLNNEGVEVSLICRVFNNGIAFRFISNKNDLIKEAAYRCDFNLPENSSIYFPFGEREPEGPIDVREAVGPIKLPVVVELSSGKHLSLMESDLYSAHGFGVMNFHREQDLLYSSNRVETTTGDITTPWRVILFEEAIGNLLTNTVLLNLATPNQLDDVSWVKPGITLWDWRGHGYEAPDGFQYGINTESYLRFIDFAAENGIDYFLIDDAWYTEIREGHIEHSDKLNLSKVIEYAEERGVDLLLYYDRRKGSYGDENLFNHYQQLGMKGIKYGFMKEDVSFTRKAIELSAESGLLINFHDSPVPFTGISRTFPNAITKEYCHAQLDARRTFTPDTFIKMALINAIQGPLDMNNGNFDIIGINSGKRDKGPRKTGTYHSTVVAEAARTLIIFSGLVCLPDAPESYRAKHDLFEFIKQQPVGKWDETEVLHGKMGAYISTARRYGQQWFIGSAASQKGATLDIELDFLSEGKTYQITYYEDSDQTHYISNPEAYIVRRGTVKKGDVINLYMAPGGGHCMWIRP